MSTLVLVTLGLLAADWDNLKAITRDRSYTVALRDGRCMRGHLVSFDAQQVVLDSGVASRVEVLRVADDHTAAVHNLIFSGRNSWADVKASGPRGTEYLLIVTKRSEQLKWKRPTISDDSIVFDGKTLAKVDVARISYVRFKPLTDNDQWDQGTKGPRGQTESTRTKC